MPLPAAHLHNKQAIVKMVKAKGLSLRGRFAPVAISGRHCRPEPAVVGAGLSPPGGRLPIRTGNR